MEAARGRFAGDTPALYPREGKVMKNATLLAARVALPHQNCLGRSILQERPPEVGRKATAS
jgi:hypothetical protein